MSEQAPEWWVDRRRPDGKLDFEASAAFWAQVLLLSKRGEERLRERDRRLIRLWTDAQEVNQIEDPLEAWTVASTIMVEAYTRAERKERSETTEATAKHVGEIAIDVLAAVDHPVGVITLGYPQLDGLLSGGMRAGELAYLTARSGVGKTAFAMEVARASAAAGCPTLVASREMPSTALGRRILAQAGRVSARAIRRGTLTQEEARQAVQTAASLSRIPLWITDDFRGVGDIHAICGGVNPAPQLVIVDYLQLLRPPKGIKERRHQVEEISKSLKALAVRMPCAVLCLSSVARPPKGARGKEPMPDMSWLRESGELEHDADIVILLHREKGAKDCLCIVAKNRDGEVGNVELTFTKEFVSFAEKERPEASGFDGEQYRA